jgi:hypothetical protein
MSKWSELTGGKKSAIDVPVHPTHVQPQSLKTEEIIETTGSETFGSWTIVASIVAVIFIVAIIALTKSSGTTLPRSSLPTHELSVIQAPVQHDDLVKDITSDPTTEDALVHAKKSSRLWNAHEDVGSEPFLGSDNGFHEYQKAFQQGRTFSTQEKSIKAFQFGLKDGLKDGLDDFLQSGHAIPDSLLESMGTEALEPRRAEVIMDDETMMLAREALQTVRGTPDAVASILKDILAARTEAASKAIKLPEMPEEQRAAVEHWSRQSGPAGQLAKQLLTRAH